MKLYKRAHRHYTPTLIHYLYTCFSTMATNLANDQTRLIVSTLYDPLRAVNFGAGEHFNYPDTPITLFRSVLVENQKVLQCSSLALFNKI